MEFWPSIYLVFFTILLSMNSVAATNKTEPGSNRKALSVFTVVKFPNTICLSSTTGRNGTCYTRSECSSKGGTASGSCASSFGVCCVFEKSCGAGSIAENCTYFTSTDITKGSGCALTICKCSSNVCQLRLDFETFVLNKPITETDGTGAGSVHGNAGNIGAFTLQGTCHVDTFGVSSPGKPQVPTICGTNTGQHMYVPAADQCNVLSANIGSASTSTSTSFTIKVTQIPCNSETLPPQGCLQYFEGSPTGTLQTYNFADSTGVGIAGTSTLLVNQHYNNCIRVERSYCSICYYTATVITGFKMEVPDGITANGALGFDTACGNVGIGLTIAISGTGHTNGGSYDYVMIPGGDCAPVSGTIASTGKGADRYCGTQFACASKLVAGIIGAPLGTICSAHKPFKLSVHSDGIESAMPAAILVASINYGFTLNYYMRTQCLYHTLDI